MKILFSILIILVYFINLDAKDNKYGDIQLLNGYEIVNQGCVDCKSFTIYKEKGLLIEFECGPNEGLWANPNKKEEYAWFKEQKVKGYKVKFAMIKSGLKTVWEPEKPRDNKFGNILLITFSLSDQKVAEDYTANFKAEILNEEELTDMILMTMTLDPSKL